MIANVSLSWRPACPAVRCRRRHRSPGAIRGTAHGGPARRRSSATVRRPARREGSHRWLDSVRPHPTPTRSRRPARPAVVRCRHRDRRCAACAASPGEHVQRLPPVRRRPLPALRPGLRLAAADIAGAAPALRRPRLLRGRGLRRRPASVSPAMVLQRTWTAGRLALLRPAVPAAGTLLEIGSGYGYFLAAARDAGFRVRGVELSRGRRRVRREVLGLDVVRRASSPRRRRERTTSSASGTRSSTCPIRWRSCARCAPGCARRGSSRCPCPYYLVAARPAARLAAGGRSSPSSTSGSSRPRPWGWSRRRAGLVHHLVIRSPLRATERRTARTRWSPSAGR